MGSPPAGKMRMGLPVIAVEGRDGPVTRRARHSPRAGGPRVSFGGKGIERRPSRSRSSTPHHLLGYSAKSQTYRVARSRQVEIKKTMSEAAKCRANEAIASSASRGSTPAPWSSALRTGGSLLARAA